MSNTESQPQTPNKLHKGQVRFGKAFAGASPSLTDVGSPPDDELVTPPQRKSLFGRSKPAPAPSPPTRPDGWTHHESYFPEYEPIYPTTRLEVQMDDAPAAKPSWTRLFKPEAKVEPPSRAIPDSYYPSYEPIYPATMRTYNGASIYTLPPSEAQALSRQFGETVAVQYPDLPAFSDYVGKDKAKWTNSAAGWSGYGWDNTGYGFAEGMAQGEANKKEGEGKKKKGKAKEGEEGEGEEGEPEDAGEAAEPAEAGGGGKKKKKK